MDELDLEFELDVLTIYDKSGKVVRTVRSSSSACERNADCNGHGVCGQDSKCVCDEGFVGGACSIPREIVVNSDEARLVLTTDLNDIPGRWAGNGTAPHGVVLHYRGVYPCLNDCSKKGECVLGECVCQETRIGDDCSVIKDTVEVDTAVFWVFFAIAIAGIVLNLGLIMFFVVAGMSSSDTFKVVRYLNPAFCIMVSVGCIIALVALPLLGLNSDIASEDTLNDVCKVYPWLLTLAWALVFSCTAAKDIKLIIILSKAQSFQKVKVSNLEMFRIIGPCLAIVLLFNILWIAIDPLELDWEAKNADTKYFVCKGDHTLVWQIVAYVLCACLILISAVLSLRNWWIPSYLSETKVICTVVYNTVLVTCVVIPLYYVFEEDATLKFVLVGAGFILVVILGLTVLLNGSEVTGAGRQQVPDHRVSYRQRRWQGTACRQLGWHYCR